MRVCLLVAVSLIAFCGCKADKCEELPAQAQIDVVVEGSLPGDADTSEVELSINGGEKKVSHTFNKVAPSFVFKFEEYDRPPRTLEVVVTVIGKSGKTLGSGRLETTFSPDGCNFLTVGVKPGGASDGGIPDGPTVDTAHDAPQPDSGVKIPGTWVTIPPVGTKPPVTFTMGSPTTEPCRGSNEDQHKVTLTRAFELQSTEVTQSQFQTLMGYSPSYFPSCGGNCPVETVSWSEAAAYCNALSAMKKLTRCYSCIGSGKSVICGESTSYTGQKIYDCPGYRLPTEAEWEYAYRAKTQTAYYSGAIVSTTCFYPCMVDVIASKIGWYRANSNVTYAGCQTVTGCRRGGCIGAHPVGKKVKNVWGLFDMAGNVWEWCHDRYQSSLGSSDVTDPWGSSSGKDRVVRGGSWGNDAYHMRAASRGSPSPVPRSDNVGFRCNRTKP